MDAATTEADVEYSPFMLALGCTLPVLGVGITCYLVKLAVMTRWGRRRREPEYVRQINKKLICNRVETERDLF